MKTSWELLVAAALLGACAESAKSLDQHVAPPHARRVLFAGLHSPPRENLAPPQQPLASPPSSPPLPPKKPPRPAQPGWHVERQGRRRYPPPRDYAQELQPGGRPTAFAPPNCSARGRVGCLAMPKPARAKPAEGVRAALLPPTCTLSSEPGCLRLPKPLSRTGHELLDGDGLVLRFRNLLPSGSPSTTSLAVADVDGDGDLDVLLGN